jgi:hypothetical protein
MAMMAAVPTVPAMHEQVNDWAQQEQYVRQCTQKMSAVLFPQEEGCHGEEHAGAHPIWESPALLKVVFEVGGHTFLLLLVL